MNACLDNKEAGVSKKRPYTDVIFIDENDPDFLSPAKVVKGKHRKLPSHQGTLNVNNAGKLVAVKAADIGRNANGNTSYKVEFETGNLDSEISSYRLSLGNIDRQAAELDKQREIIKKNLAKALKKRTQLTAQRTILVGCERRPLSDVLMCLFPTSRALTKGGAEPACNTTCAQENINMYLSKPLWELSKLTPSFDQLASEIPSLSNIEPEQAMCYDTI